MIHFYGEFSAIGEIVITSNDCDCIEYGYIEQLLYTAPACGIANMRRKRETTLFCDKQRVLFCESDLCRHTLKMQRSGLIITNDNYLTYNYIDMYLQVW